MLESVISSIRFKVLTQDADIGLLIDREYTPIILNATDDDTFSDYCTVNYMLDEGATAEVKGFFYVNSTGEVTLLKSVKGLDTEFVVSLDITNERKFKY